MARIRSWAGKQILAGLKGKYVVDTFRGQLRIRAWPRKRGTPTSQEVRDQNAWFKGANALAKRVDPQLIVASMEATKGTGLYPRDYILRGMSVGYIDVIRNDGTIVRSGRQGIEPVTFQGFLFRPTADLTIATGAIVTLTWTLPQIDTAAFWSAGTPTLITIPAGVTRMRLEAGIRFGPGITGRILHNIQRTDGFNVGSQDIDVSNNQRSVISTGVLVVIPGEQYEVTVFVTGGGLIKGTGAWYWSGEILEAT